MVFVKKRTPGVLCTYKINIFVHRLDQRIFLRLSRSAIANLNHIAPMPGGTYLVSLKNGHEITSSRLQSKLIRTRLLKF